MFVAAVALEVQRTGCPGHKQSVLEMGPKRRTAVAAGPSRKPSAAAAAAAVTNGVHVELHSIAVFVAA